MSLMLKWHLMHLICCTGISYYVCFFSSYLHAKWATVEKLLEGDKRADGKVKRFKAKQEAMGMFANVSSVYSGSCVTITTLSTCRLMMNCLTLTTLLLTECWM